MLGCRRRERGGAGQVWRSALAGAWVTIFVCQQERREEEKKKEKPKKRAVQNKRPQMFFAAHNISSDFQTYALMKKTDGASKANTTSNIVGTGQMGYY